MVCVAKVTIIDNANRRDGGVIHGGVRGGVNPSPRIGEDEYLEDLWIQWTAKAPLNAQPRGLADYLTCISKQ